MRSARFITLLLAVLAVPVVASADELVLPPMVTVREKPPASSIALRVVGGFLAGASAAATLVAIGYGLKAGVEELGCMDDCSDDQIAALDRDQAHSLRVATGLGIAAALTAAIGIPLLAVGTGQARAARKTLMLGFAPTAQGGGVSSSLTLRF